MSTKDINWLADLIVGEIGKKDAFAGDRGCAAPSNPDPYECINDFFCTADYECGGAGPFLCIQFFDCGPGTFYCAGGMGPFDCPAGFQCTGQYI